MGFIPYKVDGSNRPQSLDYLPCGAITPKKGLALTINTSTGLLAATGDTAKPEYICMREESAAVDSGTIIPVLRVNPDMVFEVPTQADNSSTKLGVLLKLYSDSLQVIATSGGKCELIGKGPKGGAAGDIVYVRIP